MSSRSHWRELIPPVISSALIPLTVAGVGWYYTQWQQNLNDLRTMIELVTDPSTEKRKYGVAMFEYLLKNDKVPVEFISAQLDYANGSSDRDFLPLLETAIQKASLVNPSVKDAFAEASERLPSRLFVHVIQEEQKLCMLALHNQMKDGDKQAIIIPATVVAKWAGDMHELRFFKAADKDRATYLASVFEGLGLTVRLKDLSVSWSGARDLRPNTFELWFGDQPLPPVCQIPR